MQELGRSLPSILLSLAGSIGLYCLTPLTPAIGQIAPDSTLGAERSIVTPNANVRGLPASLIEGGATRGENLFHSFSDFNVGEGLRVYFANPVGIENILTRVTGSNVSNILGTLGVNGTANLFLLNPNGISFGPNARLDIGGSFFASTASSFKFSDGSEFSATNPQAPPLLTVKVTPGVQWGASQPGATITNRGNLEPQQDLTLVADTLDLQGQLLSGRDLTLFATDTVKVRDSATSPFIASAGSQLLVQGNRLVDIFALNHPSSGLYSGADMVLRSGNTVGGDAHYWSGGSFRIETLDGNLGSLDSPNDPIILADGDVSLGDYEGASLHILAGGSVTLGNVTITGTDSGANTINPNNPDPFLASLATVPLSDGTTLTIDGSARATLDVRAGIDWTTFPEGSPGDRAVGTVTPTPVFAGVTRADITVNGDGDGDILVSQPDGVVLLTNQYRPNGLAGNILTQDIDTSSVDAGNGGSITINSRGNITTGGLYSSSGSGGNGGAINLSTLNGNITTGKLYSFSGSGGNGGVINLSTLNGSISTDDLFSGSQTESGSTGDGGAINLSALNGNIVTGSLFSYSYTQSGSTGDGGAINLSALNGNIVTGGLFSYSETYEGSTGDGGAINLSALNGNIVTGDLSSWSYSSSGSGGNGGAINLSALNGNIVTSGLFSYSFSSTGSAGNGGEIAFTSINGRITIKDDYSPIIDASGASGGNIILTSPVEAFTLANGLINSNASNGDGGNIQIAAPSVFLTNTELTTTAVGRGNAGSISILTDGLVSLDKSRLFTSLQAGGIGKGGDIAIRAEEVSLSNSSWIDTATFGQGNAGNVLIEANNSVSLNTNSSIFSITAGQGNGGKVTVNAGGAISLANSSNISTAVNSTAEGDGGNIDVTARSLLLTGGSQLVTSTASQGKAGNITVNTIEGVIVSGVDPNFTPAQTREIPVTPPRTVDVATAQTQNLNNFLSLDSPNNINPNVEFSSRIPYVSISGTLPPSPDTSEDSFSFEVTAGTRAIFDIDAPPSLSGGAYTVLYLLKDGQELRTNILYAVNLGAGGSTSADPYLRYVFNEPGTYTIKVGSGYGGLYNLQVSLETPNVARSVDKGVLASGLFARTEGAGTAGTVTINTPQLTVQNGGNISATATAAATSSAQGGSVQVNASQINLSGNTSGLFALTEGAAPAGSLTLQPYNNEQTLRVNFQDGAQISASTSGAGKGGSLSVTAPESVTLSGNGELSVETSGAGQAGDVTLATETLNIENGAKVSATSTATATSSAQGGSISANTSQINLSGTGGGLFAETQGVAPAGSLTLQPYNNEQSLRINFQDDTKISASTSSSGQGGSLIVTAPESVILTGNGQLSAETNSTGEAGSATINTRHLTVQDRAQVSASTSGTGQGGNLQVNASDSVLLNNEGSLVTESSGSGAAGDLTINTRELTLDNSAKVSTSTRSSQGGDITLQGLNTLAVSNSLISASTETGTAGSLSVNATESVDLSGTGGLSVEATSGGTAGDLTVKTGQMSVREGAKVTVSSPSGQAGNLNISANSLSLNRGTLSAETGTSSNEGGANINLSGLDFLLMGNESLISANARGHASGGNITINSTFIIATPPTGSQGSDIVANAVFGNGGRVSLTTQGLFGIEFRPLRTPKNDITVRSEFGLTGVFQRNSPDVDPSRGLTNLPAEFVDASNQITQNCPARGSRSENSFTITGTGGLPPRPGDAFDSPFPTGTVRSLPSSSTSSNESPSAIAVTNPVELNSPTLNRSNTTNSHTPLVEAAGWMYGPNGEVILTTVTPNFTPHGSWSTPPTCN
jgi:filamentous hemagglutinin family protein